MGKNEKNLNIFVKSNDDFSLFEKLTADEVTDYCLNQVDFIIKDLRKSELSKSYSKFNKELENVLYQIKLTIYFFREFENHHSKLFISIMNNLRGQIKQYFGNNFAHLISWQEPNIIDQFYREKVMPKMNSDFTNFLSQQGIKKNTNGILTLNSSADKIEKTKKNPNWHLVFNEMLNGKIKIIQKLNHQAYYYENQEFKNPTQLGEFLANKLGKNKSTIRSILTQSLGLVNKQDKNIFHSKNKIEISELIHNSENKMCDFFKEKLKELNLVQD